jgi:glycopeptide antibiotics resistance protein
MNGILNALSLLSVRKTEGSMWWMIWAAWTIVILGVTLPPFKYFVGHTHWDVVRWIPFYDYPLVLFDMFANFILFVPFGYLLKRALPGRFGRQAWILTFLLAVGISTGIELYQVFCHNRVPSTTDIVTNLLGAMIGVLMSQTRRAEFHFLARNRQA